MIDGWQMRIVFIFLLVRKYLLTVVLNIRVRIAGAVDELRVLGSSYSLTWPARLVGRCLKKIRRVPLELERIGPVQTVRQRDLTVPDTVRRYRLVWCVRRGGFQSVRDHKRREDRVRICVRPRNAATVFVHRHCEAGKWVVWRNRCFVAERELDLRRHMIRVREIVWRLADPANRDIQPR